MIVVVSWLLMAIVGVKLSVLVVLSALLLVELVNRLVLALGDLLFQADATSLRIGKLLPSFLESVLVFTGSHISEFLLSFLDGFWVFRAHSWVAELEFPLLNEFLFLLLVSEPELFHAFLLDLRVVRDTFSAS